MFCRNCGRQLMDGASFCTECGWKVGNKTGSKNAVGRPVNTNVKKKGSASAAIINEIVRRE